MNCNHISTAARIRLALMAGLAVLTLTTSAPADSSVRVRGPEDAVVRVNGALVGSGPLKVFHLKPGQYDVEVLQGEHVLAVRHYRVPAGQNVTFHLDARQQASAAPRSPRASRPEDEKQSESESDSDDAWLYEPRERVAVQSSNVRNNVVSESRARFRQSSVEPPATRVIYVYRTAPDPYGCTPAQRPYSEVYCPGPVYVRQQPMYAPLPQAYSAPPRNNGHVRMRNFFLGLGAAGALSGNRKLAGFGALGALLSGMRR